jgi:hypothetical protein
MIHRDQRIERMLERWNVMPGSGTAVWVADAFKNWDQFYRYFEMMFEGHGENLALQMLHDGTARKGVEAKGGGMLMLTTLAGVPGALRPKAAMHAPGPLSRSAQERPTPEIAEAVAVYFNIVGRYTGYTPDEGQLVEPVSFILNHGVPASRAVFRRHRLDDGNIVRLAQDALASGVPADYIGSADVVTNARIGLGGFTAEALKTLHQGGVPTAYANTLSSCITGKLYSNAHLIVEMYQNGVDANYVADADQAIRQRETPEDEQLTIERIIAAYSDGIPLEYLLA